MKKYRVIQKGNGAIFGEFETRVEAAKKIMEYLNDLNDGVVHLSPFDFEEIECDVNEVITDFESARKALGIKPLEGIIVSKRLEGVERFVHEINPKHIEALVALNRLFTIAEAWNKEDGFVPDFSNRNQCKYFPWFTYDDDAAGFVFEKTTYTAPDAKVFFGARLCFKTEKRAEQFGKQFTDLYNKVFCND